MSNFYPPERSARAPVMGPLDSLFILFAMVETKFQKQKVSPTFLKLENLYPQREFAACPDKAYKWEVGGGRSLRKVWN